jgi:hypothetical protein
VLEDHPNRLLPTSEEYFFALVMTPTSQELVPSAISGRFRSLIGDPAWRVRFGDLEDVLGEVDGDGYSAHRGLLSYGIRLAIGIRVDSYLTREESILSVAAAPPAAAFSAGPPDGVRQLLYRSLQSLSTLSHRWISNR